MDTLTMAAWACALFLSSALFSHDVALRLILLALSFFLVLASALRQEQRSRLLWLPPIWLPFVLWGAWAALTRLWALDPALSGKEWQNEVFYTGIACFTCYVAAQSRRAERTVLSVLAIATVLLCAAAIREYWMKGLIDETGWAGGPGNLSGVLLVVFPMALMAAWPSSRLSDRNYAPVVSAMLAICILAGAYTSLNRTVWLALMLQALIAGAILFRRTAKAPSRQAGQRAILAAVLVVVAGFSMAALTQHERFASGQDVSLVTDPRLGLWPFVASVIGERPLTGFGFGRGMLHEPLVRATGNPMLWHSHNLFIDAVLQTGIPGFLLLLALLGGTLLIGWRFARSASDTTAACGIAIILVVVGMVVRNMTDLVWQRHPALLYWGVIGVLMGWGARRDAAPPARA